MGLAKESRVSAACLLREWISVTFPLEFHHSHCHKTSTTACATRSHEQNHPQKPQSAAQCSGRRRQTAPDKPSGSIVREPALLVEISSSRALQILPKHVPVLLHPQRQQKLRSRVLHWVRTALGWDGNSSSMTARAPVETHLEGTR